MTLLLVLKAFSTLHVYYYLDNIDRLWMIRILVILERVSMTFRSFVILIDLRTFIIIYTLYSNRWGFIFIINFTWHKIYFIISTDFRWFICEYLFLFLPLIGLAWLTLLNLPNFDELCYLSYWYWCWFYFVWYWFCW